MTDSILRSYNFLTTTMLVPFPFVAAVADSALDLLAGETDGFAIEATNYDDVIAAAYVGGPVGGTVAVIDTGTPANDLSDVPLDASNLVNTGTSPKLIHFPSSPYVRWTPHNNMIQSQTFDTGWAGQGTVSVNSNAATAPNGTLTADSIEAGADQSNVGVRQQTSSGIAAVVDLVYTISIYAKAGVEDWIFIELTDATANAVGAYFDLANGVTGSSSTFGGGTLISKTIESAGSGWYRCAVTLVSTAWSVVPYFNIKIAEADNDVSVTTGDTINVWGAELNLGYIATPYLVTVASARVGIPQTYDSAASKYGIWVEPAGTNLALYSDDFTNAAWTKSNMSTAKTATGPDNGTNSATTLTASAGNATALQAITSGASDRITSTWIKRRTGSGVVELTQDNGSTWTPVTVTADWTRVEIASVSSTNPTVGIRIVTNTDAVDVFGFQHETGTVVTSLIPTLGSTATRAEDNISVLTSTTPYSATVGALYADFSPQVGATATTLAVQIDDTSNSERFVSYVASDEDAYFLVVDGGGTQANILAGAADAVVPDGRVQLTGAWAANDFAASFNGAAVVTDVSGTLPTVTQFNIGRNGPGPASNVLIYRMVYVPRRVTDGDMPTWRYNF